MLALQPAGAGLSGRNERRDDLLGAPAPLLPVRNRRYTAGEIELAGDRRLYISRGIGHLLKVRFNVRPEVTLFELAGEPPAAAGSLRHQRRNSRRPKDAALDMAEESGRIR